MRIYAYLCGVLLLAGCGGQKMGEREWTAMGTFVQVKAPEKDLARAVEIVRREIEAVEATFSAFRKDSMVGRLNAGEEIVLFGDYGEATEELSPYFVTMYMVVNKAWQTSGGVFDPTVGPLMTLWGFREKPLERIPTAKEIAATLEYVGWEKLDSGIRLRSQHINCPPTITLSPGMKLDFGAVAKGLAVDLAYDLLREAGIKEALINAGGEIIGNRKRQPWRVAVRDPFVEGGRIGVLSLTGGRATATSGKYEQFVEIDGKRYAHIINPKTGWPVTGWAQVTVVADTTADADALATSLFILGPEKGMMMLKAYPGAEALFVSDDGKTLIATRGFRREFTPEEKYERHIIYRD